jgi:hypothetical protein
LNFSDCSQLKRLKKLDKLVNLKILNLRFSGILSKEPANAEALEFWEKQMNCKVLFDF